MGFRRFWRFESLKGGKATIKFPGMSKFSAADTLELPVAERLRLVQDIWDSIAAAPEAVALTEEDKRLIDERLEACLQDPQAGSPWPEVRARIAARRK
jgi:putative addiction module component (TIGR02574 family)